jgi:hypothetical protein
MVGMGLGAFSKYDQFLFDFFQGFALGFGQSEQDENESRGTNCGIEPKGIADAHAAQQ